jgi:Flp pilus assembly pilin Flp
MHFLKDESGAVTVDWVVLTAATAGLGLAVVALLGDGFSQSSDNLGAALTDMEVAPGFAAPVENTPDTQPEEGNNEVF